MRNTEDPSSSFDLFLDTICNTFGGIVFLAILLAIMMQNLSIKRSVEQVDRQPSPEEVRALITKLDELSVEQATLQMSLDSLPPLTVSSVDNEYQDLAERLGNRKETLKQKVAIQVRASRALAEIVERNAVQQQENERVPEQLERSENKLEEVEAEFERLLASKQQTLRLPTVRTSSTISAILLLKDGAIYLARSPSLSAPDFNAAQVTTTTLLGGGIRIEPRTGTGWTARSDRGQAEFADVVRRARRGGHHLAIAVWPESYDDFKILREAMIAADVKYRLWPQSQGEDLVISFGSGGSSVQ